MKRRKFLATSSGILAAMGVGSAVEAKPPEKRKLKSLEFAPEIEELNAFQKIPVSGEGYGPSKEPDLYGFRLVSKEHDVYVFRQSDNHPDVPVDHFTVECPFPRGSNSYLPIADHQGGRIVVATDSGNQAVTKPRRVIFPVVQEGENGFLLGTDDEEALDRVFDVYDAVRDHGFDSAPPGGDAWKVVWVEFLCSDGGKEHIIAGLPEHWDSELPLDLMVKHRIE